MHLLFSLRLLNPLIGFFIRLFSSYNLLSIFSFDECNAIVSSVLSSPKQHVFFDFNAIKFRKILKIIIIKDFKFYLVLNLLLAFELVCSYPQRSCLLRCYLIRLVLLAKEIDLKIERKSLISMREAFHSIDRNLVFSKD